MRPPDRGDPAGTLPSIDSTKGRGRGETGHLKGARPMTSRMTSRFFAVIAMTLAVGFTAGAQDKPDFSGKWVAVDPQPVAANAGGSAGAGRGPGGGGRGFQPGFGPEFTVKQDAKTLTITRGGQAPVLTYKLDGSESKNTMTRDGQQIDQISTAKWEGNTLVIVTQLTFQGNTREQRRVLSLDGGNLVIDQTSPGRNGTTTVKVAYKKG
jgi:hypothetical protein